MKRTAASSWHLLVERNIVVARHEAEREDDGEILREKEACLSLNIFYRFLLTSRFCKVLPQSVGVAGGGGR